MTGTTTNSISSVAVMIRFRSFQANLARGIEQGHVAASQQQRAEQRQ